jgi:TonB-linked SusC/RagA family outer membrane protein
MNKRIFLLCILLSNILCVFAQHQFDISGTVRDAKTGEALIGVTVRDATVSSEGTITDLNGKYSLKTSSGNILFSYVGYQSRSLKVSDDGVFNITLAENAMSLNELVVIGYGTQRKSDLTGSLASISSKDIKDYPVSNVSNLLAGKAAGVYVSTSSGQPGTSAVVRIRGLGTVNDNTPLYVVDGQFMDNINNLNPDDIDHIEVLKDASACAIYGSRGSNGVVLITTKNGVKGKTILSFDAYVGVKDSYKTLKMMNSEQYYDFINKAYSDDASFQSSMKQKFANQYKKGYNTDWWKAVTHSGFNQHYNLSIRKGNDNSRSALSVGYVGEQGSIIDTEFNRLSVRLNQEYDINKYLTLGINVNGVTMRQRDTGNLPSFDFILKADPFTPVISPLVDPSSENYRYNKYAPTEWSFDPNPVSLLELPDRYNDIFNVFGNAFAQLNLAKGLTYRVQFSFERDHNTFKNFIPVYTSTFSGDNLANMESKYNTDTKMTENSSFVSNYLTEQRLNYTVSFGKANLDAMLAMTYEKNTTEGINAYKRAALGNDPIYRILSAQTIGDQVSGDKIQTAMLSYLGRINFSYDERYLATVNFRADGSSRFARENRWGYFPSFSLGWRISSEKFFENLNLDKVVSNLKLRIGWGQNGNQRIDDNASLTLIGTDNEKQWYFGTGYLQGYVPIYAGNSKIKWETSQQSNLGLDMTLFGNKLDLSMDYYIKRTQNMLLTMPVPSFGGFANNPYFNAGDLRNKGFEFTGNYRNTIGKDFNYHVGLNLSTYKTKVTRLTSEYLSGNVSRTYVGGPIGRFWGYKVIGIFQNQSEINDYVDKNGVKIQPNAKPGDFKFAKLGGSGVLNADEDRTFIGDPNPDLIYGFNLGFSWKSFDFNMAFQGTLGNDIWNTSKGSLAIPGRQNALVASYTKAWTKEGDTSAEYPRITNADTNDNYRNSSFYVEDGSYLRLQNVQLGYTVPASLLAKVKFISSCRVYLSGENVLTFTKYSGLDPDIGISNPLNMGVDTLHYPSSRAFTFGVNLQF